MKTTIDIADGLLDEARKLAIEEGSSLRAIVERGLRRVIEESAGRQSFTLRDASFKGDGVQPGIDLTDWSALRTMIYEDRGG